MKLMYFGKRLGICFIISIFFLPNITFAETTLNTALGLEQEYNTNVLYTRTDEIDDFISYIIPEIELVTRTETFSLRGFAGWRTWIFWDFTDLNRTNQDYVLDGNYRFTERWSIYGNGRFLRDSTQDSQLLDTGIVGILEDRDRLTANIGTIYELTERSNFDLGYNYQKTKWEFPGSVDTQFHDFQLAYSRRAKNERDTFSIIPQFTWGTADTYDAYDITLSGRWQRPISETLFWSFLLGVRNTQLNFTENDPLNRGDTNDWGGVADIWLEKRAERTTGRISFNNQLRTNNIAEVFNVARLLVNIDHRFSQRFGAGFRGGIWYSKQLQSTDQFSDDRWFFNVSPSLFYLLTEDFRLRLLYSYDQQYELDRDVSPRRNRQRIWLRLDLNFPDTWNQLKSLSF